MLVRLKRVYIEITNRCNLRCSFCPPTQRPARQMSVGEFRQLAAAARLHTRYIYLHLKGEPLIHPQLPKILEAAAELDLLVNLTTNGVLLPQSAALLLAAPALRQINLSVHGYAEASHGSLEDWLAALCRFARLAAAQGKFTVFRFWRMDSGQLAADDARALDWLANEFDCGESLSDLGGKRSATLAKGIFLSFEEQFEWPDPKNSDYGSAGRCYGGREMVGILADGTVVPCCLDGEGRCDLGNALETPLAELLEGPRCRALAEGFLQGHAVEPLCRHCGYRSRFDKA